MNNTKKFVAFGGSAGGIKALRHIVSRWQGPIGFMMGGVLHVSNEFLEGSASGVDPALEKVKEAVDKLEPEKGVLYLAPSGYHLLLEEDLSFALDVSQEVNYSRPSIDVFFSSVARSAGDVSIGVLLSGAGLDGANGLMEIKKAGGITIVQDPVEAEFDVMPRAALQLFRPDYIMTLDEISDYIQGQSDGGGR